MNRPGRSSPGYAVSRSQQQGLFGVRPPRPRHQIPRAVRVSCDVYHAWLSNESAIYRAVAQRLSGQGALAHISAFLGPFYGIPSHPYINIDPLGFGHLDFRFHIDLPPAPYARAH